MRNPIITATLFATTRHADQKRLGISGSPYIIHPLRIASMLYDITGNEPLTVAAILHDVLEDTEATYEQLLGEFGKYVADLVVEVTDDNALSKRQRKEVLLARMPTLSYPAQLLKIADQIDNVSEAGYDPPVTWSFDARRNYIGWCSKLVYAAPAAAATKEGQELIKLFNRAYTSSMLLIGAHEEISEYVPPRP